MSKTTDIHVPTSDVSNHEHAFQEHWPRPGWPPRPSSQQRSSEDPERPMTLLTGKAPRRPAKQGKKTASNEKLLGAPGIGTRSKDATRNKGKFRKFVFGAVVRTGDDEREGRPSFETLARVRRSLLASRNLWRPGGMKSFGHLTF